MVQTLWYIGDYALDKSIFCLFSNVWSATTLIFKELVYINRIHFFTAISKSVITYITSTVTNISNNIIKQHYGIIKTFKVLIIVKKKRFIRPNTLI